MKKFTFILCCFALISFGLFSCSNSAEKEAASSNETTEESGGEAAAGNLAEEPIEEPVEEIAEEESSEEESSLGAFKGLVGEWTVDAETAGIRMDISFGADGTYKQSMGTSKSNGTWEIIDDQHLIIVTQNTKGQKWRVSELDESGVNICWNPDSEKPKTIPFTRVK